MTTGGPYLVASDTVRTRTQRVRPYGSTLGTGAGSPDPAGRAIGSFRTRHSQGADPLARRRLFEARRSYRARASGWASQRHPTGTLPEFSPLTQFPLVTARRHSFLVASGRLQWERNRGEPPQFLPPYVQQRRDSEPRRRTTAVPCDNRSATRAAAPPREACQRRPEGRPRFVACVCSGPRAAEWVRRHPVLATAMPDDLGER